MAPKDKIENPPAASSSEEEEESGSSVEASGSSSDDEAGDVQSKLTQKPPASTKKKPESDSEEDESESDSDSEPPTKTKPLNAVVTSGSVAASSSSAKRSLKQADEEEPKKKKVKTSATEHPKKKDEEVCFQELLRRWRPGLHPNSFFTLTFVAYIAFHAARKPNSIVKGTLSASTVRGGWSPFDGPDGTALLGQIDLAFLSVYAVGMFVAGHLGDRLDLRTFLTIGMIGTGLFTALFGVAFWANFHSFYYFLAVQVLAGWFQSIGWPCVVAVLGNWFDKKRRGMIMGVWSAHTSLGNITGSLLASGLLRFGWGWSFLGPALLITFLGLVVYFFLPVNPPTVGAERDGTEVDSTMRLGDTITESFLGSRMSTGFDRKAIGFMAAWKIPGVAPFAFCLFFTKLVSYTFLYWLPFYVSHNSTFFIIFQHIF
ncbi:hypothetical protein F2Q68_00030140 [Brassica cretica]|uniref:Major facilitator superfamily (MFS) profile domain-containing protein n=1 Tax=Brassica cretica TaxID=69181 RepID=A0A8S9GCG1_BRACR|nr:hypothetical protein F2Q68_00030140 [Brassica cretica]